MSSIYTKADNLFRKYLLKKSVRNELNQIFCPLTNKWWDEDLIHVCHYVPRNIIHLRYDEVNCILCSSYSNIIENNIQLEDQTLHIKKFGEFLGTENIKYLEKEKKEGKLMRKELENLINSWKI